ncbi:hypothetical protein WH279_21630 [Erwinia sp. MYb375]|uniref:hypothetical protein n=1 Tax=unclassified Erwinia TaxID=2622719 RepID=UPI00309AE27C
MKTKKIKSVKEAIKLYEQYMREMDEALKKYYDGDFKEEELSIYSHRVEGFPNYLMSKGEITMDRSVEKKFSSWLFLQRSKIDYKKIFL